MNPDISIVSFNINGTRGKDFFIDDLYVNYDVVCLQEHLLTAFSENFLRRSSDHVVFVRPAKITRGRPSGGLACVFKKNISGASPVLFQSDDTFLAVRLGNVVLINVYLPYNDRSIRSLQNFSCACNGLKTLIQKISDNGLHFVIAGDFNTDLVSDNVRNGQLFDSLPAYKIVRKSHDYTYIHHSGSKSDIDHVICSAALVCSPVTVHFDENDLDHLPLSFCLSKSVVCSGSMSKSRGVRSKWFYKPDWNDANFSVYLITLASLLSTIYVPYQLLQCSQNFIYAKYEIDRYYHSILSAMKEAEKISVPVKRIRKNTQKPLWSLDPNLKACKNKAKFWLKIWTDCGRPRSGNVFLIKQKTKLEFKKYLKSVRYRGLDFPSSPKDWRKVINSSKTDDSDVSSNAIPPSSWHAYYSKIFSVLNYSVHRKFGEAFVKIVPRFLSQRFVLPISRCEVLNALNHLKSKSIDADGISKMHLTPQCAELVSHLALLFQMCLASSVVPESFLCGSVTSILKRGKPPTDCSSYRPVSVSCNISKVFEYILLPNLTRNISFFGENQLGFRPGVGCQHAHRVLSSILLSNSSKGKGVYLCTLDLSKAFDSVVHNQLFFSLAFSGVNFSVIYLLRFWYSNSYLRLKSSPETTIKVLRGVRQGGVLSPTLFKICISTVLEKISGTYFSGSTDISYIAYADDILLISRTKSALSAMVSLVSQSFLNIGLSLNLDKCEFLSYNLSSSTPLVCNEFSVLSVSSFRWLGITVSNSLALFRKQIVADSVRKIQFSYSKIVANRGKYNRRALGRLFSTFSDHSVLYFSGVHSVLKLKDLKKIKVTYFKFCKFLLSLPPWTRNRYLVKNFYVTDVTQKLGDLHKKLSADAFCKFGPDHGLLQFFS